MLCVGTCIKSEGIAPALQTHLCAACQNGGTWHVVTSLPQEQLRWRWLENTSVRLAWLGARCRPTAPLGVPGCVREKELTSSVRRSKQRSCPSVLTDRESLAACSFYQFPLRCQQVVNKGAAGLLSGAAEQSRAWWWCAGLAAPPAPGRRMDASSAGPAVAEWLWEVTQGRRGFGSVACSPPREMNCWLR